MRKKILIIQIFMKNYNLKYIIHIFNMFILRYELEKFNIFF